MHLHSNAALLPRQRQLIQASAMPYATLAQQFQVSKATIHHWKHQQSCLDRSCHPKTVHCALDNPEEEFVLWLRRTAHLPLDELLDAVQEVLPHARRSSLHRLLVRNGCSRLPKQQQQPSGQPGTFKEYGPGYLPIDCFYLPKLNGQKHPCFVAVGCRPRNSPGVFGRLRKQRQGGRYRFPEALLGVFPFQGGENPHRGTLWVERARVHAARLQEPLRRSQNPASL